MKTVSNWRDLEEFGIDALTGEACGLNMRLLCDVTELGKEIIESFFGNTMKIKMVELKKGSNWNSRGVASIMLTRGILKELGEFCLRYRYRYLFRVESEYCCANGELHGTNNWRDVERMKQYYGEDVRIVKGSGTAMGGLRNTHAMSGRTV